jgi:hypothetical protein
MKNVSAAAVIERAESLLNERASKASITETQTRRR